MDLGLSVYGFGILGGVLFSIYLTWNPRHMLKSAFIVCISSMMTLAYFYFANTRADKTELFVASSILGFLLLPILFVAYELAVSQTAHLGVGENMSCGLINVTANILGFLVAISLTPALDKETTDSTDVTFLVMFINLAIALLFLILGSVCGGSEPSNRHSDRSSSQIEANEV